MRLDGFALGWQSSRTETPTPVPLDGKVPEWLDGVLIRNGPALYEVGPYEVGHQFDGFSKLSKFNFTRGTVYFQSRFLGSSAYKQTIKRNRLIPHIPYHPVRPAFKYVSRIASLFAKDSPRDNNNINVHYSAGRLYATSDSANSNVVDPRTLDVVGTLNPPRFSGFISAAHPQRYANCTFNYLCDPASRELRLYRDDGTRAIIGATRVDHVPLMHSFSVTERFVVLFQYPFSVDAGKLLTGATSMMEVMRWFGKTKCVKAFLFDARATRTMRPVRVFRLPSFFSMHCVNAFDEGDGKLSVDLLAYRDAAFVSEPGYGQLELMRSPDRRLSSDVIPDLCRIEMDAQGGATMRSLGALPFEMPAINNLYHGKKYECTARRRATCTRPGGISKTSVSSPPSLQKWRAPPNHFPSEAIFVPLPNATREDDGVLLDVVFDADRNTSYLLVLDARGMTPLTQIDLPERIPFDVHGKWIDSFPGA